MNSGGCPAEYCFCHKVDKQKQWKKIVCCDVCYEEHKFGCPSIPDIQCRRDVLYFWRVVCEDCRMKEEKADKEKGKLWTLLQRTELVASKMASYQGKEDPYEQFKSGHQRHFGTIFSKNYLFYKGDYIQIGLQNNKCICDAHELKIRETFQCDRCTKLHSYKCSTSDTRSLIANDYFRNYEEERNLCFSCEGMKKQERK